MSQKPRRKFTAEQKAETVRIVEESGKPISRVAKEMGLTESALRNWVKQSKIDQQGARQGPLTSEEREELNSLRRELKRVRMERDFLKKAATFFAKESSNPSVVQKTL
ncbi:transposase [Sphaerothrix gracilis]|uniref:transposase n=1 Tax=Sphaerothrix gracilis TaxID=3151835 RepID=UPI0031FC8AB0